MRSTAEVRQLFIDFFAGKNHQTVASSSLIPAEDPTLLFVNAGMVQFKDVFLGAEKRSYTRATSSQRCVRAGGKHNDLDQVGYTARHHTFFEMLGNFSFGDYFKQEAIEYAWEFLTAVVGLPVEKLWVTVYEEDDEAEQIWRDVIGFPAERISRIGAKDNFWQMGDTGPCGPCTEIFYDHGESIAGGPPGTPEEDGDRYIEIWNLVFMQFDRQPDGSLQPLPNPCVDTGMGLERIASILQGKHDNYDIDLFQALIAEAARLTGYKDLGDASLKVIADHIRTCAFLIADGVLPSNEGRGYVLRRIIRRALRHGHKLGASEPFFHKMLGVLIVQMGEAYPELKTHQDTIEKQLLKEELKFAETLDTGMQLFKKATRNLQADVIPGEIAFKLYDTYGFPLDLTQDVAREQGQRVDVAGFENCMSEQKKRSRSNKSFTQTHQLSAESVQELSPTQFTGYDRTTDTATVIGLFSEGQALQRADAGQKAQLILDATPFYAESGGQVGDIGVLQTEGVRAQVLDTQKVAGQYHLHEVEVLEGTLEIGLRIQAIADAEYRNKVILNHSATHLLHKVLREYLGNHVQQKGSLVNADKLRFDFSHEGPLSAEDVRTVEQRVNQAIRQNYSTEAQLMAYDQAIQSGAMALFGEKYGDEVRVLSMGDFSVELCGGTHVQATGDIGLFKIIEETSVAAGVRRIEAVTGDRALAYIQSQDVLLSQAAALVNATAPKLPEAVTSLLEKNKALEKQLEQVKKQQLGDQLGDVFDAVEENGGKYYLQHVFEQVDSGQLRDMVDRFKSHHDPGIVVFASANPDGKVQLVVGVTKGAVASFKAGNVIKDILAHIGGRGGGRPDFAQGGGDASADEIRNAIEKTLSGLQEG
ncbi:alanine--tRNA ligase [Marinicella sp. W31]|uniref:alanine--tRNA ligase n=1 Tax=Marinicella sp. W31 TaxID=3023713 RepID=UPI00375708F0